MCWRMPPFCAYQLGNTVNFPLLPPSTLTIFTAIHIPVSLSSEVIAASPMTSQFRTAVPAKQSLSQTQSVATVQIFLNAAVGCISYVRELIPWTSRCFRTRYIDQIVVDGAASGERWYSDFCYLDSKTVAASQEVRVLVRGQNRRADQILDMIVPWPQPPSAVQKLTDSRSMGCLRLSERAMLRLCRSLSPVVPPPVGSARDVYVSL